MKMIVAIVQQYKLEELREALVSVGVKGMTVTEVKGFGQQKGNIQVYRASEVKINFLSKIKFEIVVADDQVNEIIKVITHTAKTGKIGDGKIFVIPIEEVIRIRTGDRGEGAL